jgi:SNF2 family DNA or RNA helicase
VPGAKLPVTAQAVLQAWLGGHSLVPISGGGFAPLPIGWLEAHGQRVADLLAAHNEDGSLPPFAKLDAAHLLEELDTPHTLDLGGLAAVVDDFDRLPAAERPADLTATLRGYQERGVDWLCFLRDTGLGGILADDMGLGKTVQALCALQGHSLVVCPTSVVPNWADEVAKFRPNLSVCVFHGPKRSLDPDADVVITTYALLRNDIEKLAAITWDAVVLDEAQAIKNPESQAARAAYRLQAKFRVALSGTPVENRLDELWSQLHFTNPGLLGGRSDFARRYAGPIEGGNTATAARLRQRIRPFVLRRLKRTVAPELPPRTESVLHVELSDDERTTYDAVRAASRADIVKMLDQGGNVLAALEALLRLRQAACHPALLPNTSAESSSKVAVLRDAIEAAHAGGSKSLVFSQWTSMLDLIEPHLAEAGIDRVRLDGSTRDRAGVVKAFQDPTGPPVLLASLKAGGTGLNLTAADHVFLVDPWWNPAAEDQAADRAHRIGQDKPVMVYRLVTRDTVEERILELQRKKRAVANAALDGSAAAASLSRDDLLALLR